MTYLKSVEIDIANEGYLSSIAMYVRCKKVSMDLENDIGKK